MLQTPEKKFQLRQSEVSSAGLFSDEKLFKEIVGPIAKPTPTDKWAESTAALSKAIAACTKVGNKPQPSTSKKQGAPKQNTSAKKPQSKSSNNNYKTSPRKRQQKNKSTKNKDSKQSTAAAAAAATKKATENKNSE